MAKTKEQIFDSKIAPLLEQINGICKHYDIASIYAFQLTRDAESGQMMSVNGYKATDTITQMDVARQILSGKVSVMAVPATEAMELGITEGVMKLVKKHAETCPDCAMKISAAEISGETLSLADFRHDEVDEESVEAVEAVEAIASVEAKPKKKRTPKKNIPQVSKMFPELFERFAVGSGD